jgi:membrane-bound serine protease (ClpP class)
MRRTLRRVNDEGAAAVVFDIHTPGGLAWETSELMMGEMTELKVPSFAFVNTKAMSAGALISVATDRIYMRPVSTIGSAALVAGTGQEIEKVMRAKMESAYDAFVRSVVKKKGHNLDVVRAMMFMEKEYWFDDVKVPRDALLTLTADEAVGEFEGKPLLAAGIVENVEELLKKEGLESAPVVNAEPTGFERLAWWVKYFSPILILVGLGAGYLEMKAPGFGLGGGISLLAFGLFFFGNYAAGNLAGYELAGLFVLGIVLILVEVFLIPGTGVAGILGILAVMASLFLAMVDRFDFEAIETDGISFDGVIQAISYPSLSLALALIGSIIVILLLMRYLPRIPYFGGLLLKKQSASGAAMDEKIVVDGGRPVESRVGWTGETLTDLRPTGKAEFDGEVVDVSTGGEFVGKGSKVRIVSESGMGALVREIERV